MNIPTTARVASLRVTASGFSVAKRARKTPYSAKNAKAAAFATAVPDGSRFTNREKAPSQSIQQKNKEVMPTSQRSKYPARHG